MKIGDVEKKTGLNAKTIRYYESRGLIQVSRTGNQYRTYNEETVAQLLDVQLDTPGESFAKEIIVN